jgi:p-cumate 2,3-dioxygenase alpha subunit
MESKLPGRLVIGDQKNGLFRVNRQAFTDPEVLELEKRKVFDQCWIYAGYESEISKPGDFVSRRIAGRPIILVRGEDGNVRALLNSCTHRGAMVCRERAGNVRSFQCAYHAWTFNNQGELIGVPGENAYSEAFDRNERALANARVESYRGFIFVSFNPAVEPLTDYLAGAKEYLDLVCDQSDHGMEIISGTQVYSIRSNWKLLVENSIDGYHAVPTHKRYFMEFLSQVGVDVRSGVRLEGYAKSLGNGHAVIGNPELPVGRPVAQWIPAWGEAKRVEMEAKVKQLEQRFGPWRAYQIAKVHRNLLIFPNLIINDIMSTTIRTFFPIAPDYMEVTAWALGPKEESQDYRALRLDNFLTFLGPGGYATPDDVEMLEECQMGFSAAREVEWSDISRGMLKETPIASDELQVQTFWRRWNELVSGPHPVRSARKAA